MKTTRSHLDELYGRIIDGFPVPLVELDQSLRIVRFNRRFGDTFEPGPNVGPNSPLMDALPDKLLETTLGLGFESGEWPPEMEITFPEEGEERGAFLVSVARRAPGTETILVAFHEVTAWKKRQQKMMEASRLASLGAMVAGMAHEINNPLAGIMGLSQLALRQELAPPVRRDVTDILAQAKKASEVVANLRIFAGIPKHRSEPVNIVRVLQKVLDMKSDWFRARGISITSRTGQSSYIVEGDEHQLEQAFVNIITNAQQAMLEGGTGKSLDIKVSTVDGRVRLSFSDDGPGIHAGDLPKVFDPFFTTREVGKGTGLGLSMCHRIVDQHGGTIRATSAPGKGTTFTIELPISEAVSTASTSREQDISANAAPGRLKVLVVDDEPIVTELLARILSEQGHSVDTASTGSEVIVRSDLDIYDLILLDVKMPGVGGAELFDYIRQLPGEMGSRVVFVTGDTANIDTQQLVESSGNPMLAKPFTFEELMETVGRVAAESRQTSR